MSILAKIIVVVLDLKPASVPKLIVRATAIVNAMASNKTVFPTPTPPLAQVTADITALTNAETALKSRIGTRTDRDSARSTLVADINQLHAYVQQLANATPADAATIAGDAAMALRKSTLAHKPPLAVKQTVSGSVKVVAKATKGAKANEWQYSLDGGKTWIDLPQTTKATTTVTGLTPGVTITYRQRVFTKTGLGDWSQPISALVA